MKSIRIPNSLQNTRFPTSGGGRLPVAELVQRFAVPGVLAIALTGSHARGDAGPFSDVDLLCLVEADMEIPGEGTHMLAGLLVVVGHAPPERVEHWFTLPQEAVAVVQALRDAVPLFDPTGHFAGIQQRATDFTWTPALQEAANAYAGSELVGWIEEAHKGLEGLLRGDNGRLLNARFGLSWGLTHVMQVQRGVLRNSDNDFDALANSLGRDSRWVKLQRQAFGIQSAPLAEQVQAGLLLYVETASLLADDLPKDAVEKISVTCEKITSGLAKNVPAQSPGA